MKLALFADVHANRHALEACLAHAEQAGADRFAFLGDLVGYGGEPEGVVRRVQALCESGAIAIRGNHDQYASSEIESDRQHAGHLSAEWTFERLSSDERAFLASLPLTYSEGSFLLVHASAHEPSQWRYVDSPELAAASLAAATRPPSGSRDVHYVFGGHVHVQMLFFQNRAGKLRAFTPVPGVPVQVPPHRHWLAMPGSVGQPRDGRVEAMYALFDDTAQILTFHRVPYDLEGAIAAIRATSLPSFFAERLEQGR